jgi:endonuclease YncB( thermonuclease family)
MSEAKSAYQKYHGLAVVKAVTSGDTVVVVGGRVGETGIPSQKMITLQGLDAPKLARGTKSGAHDEPFAFHSREYLRKKVRVCVCV